MSAITVRNPVLHRRVATSTTTATVSRSRRDLASTLELTLDPRLGVRRGLRTWPRVPRANRDAVAEPLGEIVSLLRDPAVAISERAEQRVRVLATHPTSPAYGQHPNRAGFAAWSLLA